MCDKDFWFAFNEDFGPEVLDERIREKIVADLGVIFLKSSNKRNSVDLHSQVRKRSTDGAREEQGEHLANALIILKSIW